MATKQWGDFKDFYTTEMLLNQCISSCSQLNTDKIFIIGGQQLYESTFDIVDELWITEVDQSYDHADRFYNIPDGFKMFENSGWIVSGGVSYRFTKWLKVEDFPF